MTFIGWVTASLMIFCVLSKAIHHNLAVTAKMTVSYLLWTYLFWIKFDLIFLSIPTYRTLSETLAMPHYAYFSPYYSIPHQTPGISLTLFQ